MTIPEIAFWGTDLMCIRLFFSRHRRPMSIKGTGLKMDNIIPVASFCFAVKTIVALTLRPDDDDDDKL